MAISTSLSTALTGLKAHQTALDVTSNNISNASNPDYVRERAIFVTSPPINTMPGDIGTGAKIESIYRVTDTFLFGRYTSTSASFANLDTQEQYLKEIATYFPDVTDNGLYKDIEDFFNAWQTFANNPNDGAVKVDLASKTQALSDNIKTLQSKLTEVQKNINDTITSKITEANTIIKEIAGLTKQIVEHEAGDLAQANELRDKRDAFEKRLKELLGVDIYKNGTASRNAQGESTIDGGEEYYQISLGGYPIVDNITYHKLILQSSAQNPMIGIQKQDYSIIDESDAIKGGEIGALLSVRGTKFNTKGNPINGTLGKLMNSLDSLSSGIIRSINSVYSYSAQKSVETDVIVSPNPVSADLRDTSLDSLYSVYGALKTSVRDGDLILTLYNNQGEVDMDTQLQVHITPDDSINDVIDKINDKIYNNDDNADYGASIVNGQLKFVKGDFDTTGKFIAVEPKKETSKILVKDDGARLFTALNQIEYQRLEVVNNADLPLKLKNGSFDIEVYNDNGDVLAKRTIVINMDSKDPKYSTLEGILAQINTPSIDDNADNNLNNDIDDYYQAEFLSGKFVLAKKTNDSVYIALNNDTSDFGGAFGINKFFDGKDASSIRLKDEFQKDPSLIKASKTSASGDNTVANAVLQLQYENIIFYNNDGTSSSNTILGYYRNITSDLANETQTISTRKESTQTLLTSISNEYYSLSGVNVDEELVNLEKFQRGYQANAKVVTTINKMLDALFNMT